MSRCFLFFLFFILSACSGPPEPVRDPSHPDLRLERVAIRSWSADKLRVVMTATRLDLFREVGTPGDVVATDAGLLIVADGSRLTAPLVTGNIFSGQFEGKGGVRMAGPGSLAAGTPAVAFDRAAGLASSDAGVVLTRPQGGVVRITGDALRASLSEPRAHPPRITIEGANLRFEPGPGAKPYLLSAARKLDVALRAGPDDQAAFLFHAEGARLNLQGLAGRIADQGEGTIDWTLVFTRAGALHGRDWPHALKSWADAGGVLHVDDASLQVGQAVLKTTGGSLSLQADGRLKGSLPASLKAVGGSGQTIKGDVSLSNGEAMQGPLRIGPAPKLF